MPDEMISDEKLGASSEYMDAYHRGRRPWDVVARFRYKSDALVFAYLVNKGQQLDVIECSLKPAAVKAA